MQCLDLEGRKWEIFESTIYTFAERGYDNVSMREIAQINHIQAASIYYYFDSKDTLLELMYKFYSINILEDSPDINELLSKIPLSAPKDILFQCLNHFSAELQPLMDCIYIIALSRQNYDSRAYDLIRRYTFLYPGKYIQTVLQAMIDAHKIEPIDLDCFSTLYTSVLFCGAARNRTPAPLHLDYWAQCLDLLFSLVKEK